jgi:hypothetical protein
VVSCVSAAVATFLSGWWLGIGSGSSSSASLRSGTGAQWKDTIQGVASSKGGEMPGPDHHQRRME